MGANNLILSIKDSLQYICGTLEIFSTLANTIHNEFNGDLNGAIQSEIETQVQTLKTLTKLCDAVATIQNSRNEGQNSPQLDKIYERLSQIRQKLDLKQAPCHLESQLESHIQSLKAIPRELPPFAKEEANGMMDLTQSSKDEDSNIVIATNRMPMCTEFFLPEFHTTSVLQKGVPTLGSAMKADRSYEKEELDH